MLQQPEAAPPIPATAPARVAHTARPGVSIFVYELPPDIAFRFGRHIDPNYAAEWAFLQTLLADRSVRTLDPEAADLFVIPFLSVFGAVSNRMCDRARLELAVRWIRGHHPFWDRSGGRDHAVFLTGDRGACGMGTAGTNLIFVTHFGLLGPFRLMKLVADEGRASWPMTLRPRLRRLLFEHAKKSDDSQAHQFDGVGLPQEGTHSQLRSSSLLREHMRRAIEAGEWCYSPHKDVLAAPFTLLPPPFNMASSLESTTHDLFFAGGIWGPANVGPRSATYYSMGVRQRLFADYGEAETDAKVAIWNASRVERVGESPLQSWRGLMNSSKFCLAPNGDGWGIRITQTILAGCVPLIAQPFTEQPLESVLPYHTFARRIETPEELSPHNLSRLLNSEGELGSLRSLRRAQSEMAPAFSWATSQGGLGYNYTILSLCHRAQELRGFLKAGSRASCSVLAGALPGASATRHNPMWYPDALAEATALGIRARHKFMTGTK